MSLAMQVEPVRRLVSAKKLAPLSFLFLLTAVDAVWATLRHVRFTGFETSFCIVIVLLTVSVTYGQVRKDRRLSEASYFVALWGLFTAVAAPLTYMAATLNLPLYDEGFAMADSLLGFDWLGYYNFFAKHKIISAVLMAAYFSFAPQICFSVIYFSHSRKHDRNDELFWTASIAGVITGAASGIFPAAGTLHHFRTGLIHAVHLHDFFALRDGSISQFILGKMEGIVTFPSYHTVAAILLIYVYRRTPIFLFILALNAMMLLSTPIFGGHYLVDMLGGGAVALFSIFAANRVRSWLNDGSILDTDGFKSRI